MTPMGCLGNGPIRDAKDECQVVGAYSVLGTRYSVLGTRYSVSRTSPLASRPSPLAPRPSPLAAVQYGASHKEFVMEKMSVTQARREAAVGRQVKVSGWIRTRRDSKGGFSFLEVNDGSCFGNLQVVADGKLS